MKKEIWFILGAALLAAAVLLLLPRSKQSPASTEPTLPTLVAVPGVQHSDSAADAFSDGPEPAAETEIRSAHPEIPDGLLDPAEDPSQERSESGSANPGSELSEPSPDSSGESASLPTAPDEVGAPETSLPANPGGISGFPILPPDIFP